MASKRITKAKPSPRRSRNRAGPDRPAPEVPALWQAPPAMRIEDAADDPEQAVAAEAARSHGEIEEPEERDEMVSGTVADQLLYQNLEGNRVPDEPPAVHRKQRSALAHRTAPAKPAAAKTRSDPGKRSPATASPKRRGRERHH
jgi:hypothetical protein